MEFFVTKNYHSDGFTRITTLLYFLASVRNRINCTFWILSVLQKTFHKCLRLSLEQELQDRLKTSKDNVDDKKDFPHHHFPQ